MSPSALGGPPHTRASSINGRPVGMTNGNKIIGADGMKGASRVFPHLDDLLAVKPDVDINWPMRKLLQEADLLAKQADTHLDFRRPDIALQEYLKAAIVAIDYVPRHKDYPSLQQDRGELHRLYSGLKKRIDTQHDKFADVKEIIKENNVRSGVASKLAESRAKPLNGLAVTSSSQVRTQSVPNAKPNGSSAEVNGTNGRKKPPPVQPKPNALHGNVIHSEATSTSKMQPDLAERFARLRSPERDTSMQQDPRIRTQPITIPPGFKASPPRPISQPGNMTTSKPSGPRELPSVPKTIPRHINMPLAVDIPAMPRAPDAIYSPASGTGNASTINLPSSIARNSSYLINGRKTAPPVSTVGPTPDLNESRKDYFSAPSDNAANDPVAKAPRKSAEITLPNTTTVTAEQLMKYIALGSQTLSILLVDIRSREDFNNGHIMSRSIICVEPITLRNGISGEQLGESMVIAPDSEQALYDRRSEFDLVVFYDQSTKAVHPSTSLGKDNNSLLRDLSSAVYEYGYEKKLKRRPMLLIGGLDAWVDLLGPNSLKSSSSKSSASTSAQQVSSQSSRTLGRFNIPGDGQRRPVARTKSRTSRPLTKEEESRWDLTAKQDMTPASPSADPEASNEFIYARTLEGFLNKYPEMPVIQESMVSQGSDMTVAHSNQLASTLPSFPTRPAPALPRQRSSGINERGTLIKSYANSASDTAAGTITPLRVSPGLTGLQNPQYLCYMNSSLQALSATPFLRNLLRGYKFPPTTPLPRRAGETSDPPQLMVRIFGNLLSHMWSGQYDFLQHNTFSRYVNSVHHNGFSAPAERSACYGSPNTQHDSSEFSMFLLDILDDELNTSRDKAASLGQPLLNDAITEPWNKSSWVDACMNSWKYINADQRSPITQRMKAQEVTAITCSVCKNETRTFNTVPMLTLALRQTSGEQTLRGLFNAIYGDQSLEVRDNIECRYCNAGIPDGDPRRKRAPVTARMHITRMPDYLIIALGRFLDPGRKNMSPISFEESIDLTPYFPVDGRPATVALDREHTGPFRYDVYAVQRHRGSLANGHYWTVARSPDLLPANSQSAGAWHDFNDPVVTPATFKTHTQGVSPSVIYLKRQGVP